MLKNNLFWRYNIQYVKNKYLYMYYWFTKEANKNVNTYWPFVPDYYFMRLKKWGSHIIVKHIILFQITTQASSDIIVFYIKLL